MQPHFSRMRSEGFPFIVGGLGVGSCSRRVRRVVVVSSSPSSSPRRRVVVNFSLLGGTHALRPNPFLQSMKMEEGTKCLFLALPSHKMWGRFRVLRDRRNTLEACQCKRVVFSWQAQHFVMWPFAMSWQAQHFVTWRRCCFHKSHWQGRANVTLFQISWQAQQFVSVLKSGGSFAKVILFELCENGSTRKTRTKSSIFKLKVWSFRVLRGRRKTLEAPCLKSWGSLARNARFGSFVAWKVEEASHEMLVLEVCSLKSWGSLARSARFGSLFLEKLRKPRTKCSFWKLVPWKVKEASHEMLFLEACSLKNCGSLARNARFGSLFLEKLRKPRTKCSFWKLVFSLYRSWGSLARNARFGNFSSTLWLGSSTGVVLCSTE